MRLYRIAERRDKYGNTCKEWKLYKTIPELPRIEVFRARILIDAECHYCGMPLYKGDIVWMRDDPDVGDIYCSTNCAIKDQ